jgi:hypothetical protein
MKRQDRGGDDPVTTLGSTGPDLNWGRAVPTPFHVYALPGTSRAELYLCLRWAGGIVGVLVSKQGVMGLVLVISLAQGTTREAT